MGRLAKLLPFLIVTTSILSGIIQGINLHVTEYDSSVNLWTIMSFFSLQNDLTKITWINIYKHNLFLAVMYGILGFFSGGLFAIKFLYVSWSLWIHTLFIYLNNPFTIAFVLLEAISITFLVLCIMYYSYEAISICYKITKNIKPANRRTEILRF